MKILLTNDDGIHAEGMKVLMNWAKTLGEVSVFAPKVEQSAKSHAVEIHKPFEVKKVALFDGSEGYSVDSTPADCVRFAVLGLHETFDLVISGVNRGLNIGRDIMYSGTVAAAFEASSLGMKALAVSTEPATFKDAEQHLNRIWTYISKRNLYNHTDILNVNIPCGTSGQILITRQGGPYYSDDFPAIGNDLYRPTGHSIHVDRGDLTLDTDATLSGNITITPLTIDRTNRCAYDLFKLN